MSTRARPSVSQARAAERLTAGCAHRFVSRRGVLGNLQIFPVCLSCGAHRSTAGWVPPERVPRLRRVK
jgi:hypothetical protein